MRGSIAAIEEDIACPACKSPAHLVGSSFLCDSCGKCFPVVDGVPILIDRTRSVFDGGLEASAGKTERPTTGLLRRLLQRATPSITANWCAETNLEQLAVQLRSARAAPKVLVVGAGDGGAGVERLLASDEIIVISSDVVAGDDVDMVADGHDLPFRDASFDAVVLQAVLEHVADPFRCVDEAFRVLRPNGLVYAETPFMYPGHLGAYDFHRFSTSGHRRLFRHFTEVQAGVGAGPATAAALAIQSLLASFSTARPYRLFVLNAAPFLLGWLKYLDRYLVSKPQAADCACTLFFLGRKCDTEIADREVISAHWTERQRSTQGEREATAA